MLEVVPIVGQPEEGGDAHGQFEVTADVVVIQGFVEPVSIPE